MLFPTRLKELTVHYWDMDDSTQLTPRPHLAAPGLTSALTHLTMTGSSGSLANTDSLVRSGSIPLLAELTVEHTVFSKAKATSFLEGLGQHVPTTLRALRLDGYWREDDYDTVEENLLVAQPIPTSLYTTTFTALSIHIYIYGPPRPRPRKAPH